MAVRRFKKRPVVIEAIQYQPHENCGEIARFIGSPDEVSECVDEDELLFIIPTLEGNMEASPGDWIIKGIAGEFYPCKSDIFEQTYEEVSDV